MGRRRRARGHHPDPRVPRQGRAAALPRLVFPGPARPRLYPRPDPGRWTVRGGRVGRDVPHERPRSTALPADGRELRLRALDLFEIRDGKVQHESSWYGDAWFRRRIGSIRSDQPLPPPLPRGASWDEPVVPDKRSSTSSADTRRVIEGLFDAAATGVTDEVLRWWADDGVLDDVTLAQRFTGKAELGAYLEMYYRALPDLDFKPRAAHRRRPLGAGRVGRDLPPRRAVRRSAGRRPRAPASGGRPVRGPRRPRRPRIGLVRRRLSSRPARAGRPRQPARPDPTVADPARIILVALPDPKGAPVTHRIEWVRSSCRMLNQIAAEFERTQPFAGLTIGTGIHLEPKTVALLLTLQAGGADVVSTGNLNSTQPERGRLPARARRDRLRRPDPRPGRARPGTSTRSWPPSRISCSTTAATCSSATSTSPTTGCSAGPRRRPRAGCASSRCATRSPSRSW